MERCLACEADAAGAVERGLASKRIGHPRRPNHTVPYETVSFLRLFQAINCQVAFADYGAPDQDRFAGPMAAIAT